MTDPRAAEVHPFCSAHTIQALDAAAQAASERRDGQRVGRTAIAAEVLRLWASGRLREVADDTERNRELAEARAERDDARAERNYYLASIRAAWAALDCNDVPSAYDALDVGPER